VGPGGIFGEVSLLTNEPRQADCIAATDKVKVDCSFKEHFLKAYMFRVYTIFVNWLSHLFFLQCMALSRDAFERLMGPVENSLQRHIEEYRRMNAQQRRSTGP